jgi:serine/threonine protein kinase
LLCSPSLPSPELFQGQPASASSDIYAYGILLNEIFSREVPFDGVDVSEIRRRVVGGERPPIALTVPREVATIIKECVSQLPMQRPKDLNKIIATLTAMQQTTSSGQ